MVTTESLSQADTVPKAGSNYLVLDIFCASVILLEVMDEKTPHIKLRYAARRGVAKVQMKFVKQCIDDAPYTMLDTMYNYFKQYGALKGEAKKVLSLVDSPEVKAKAKEEAARQEEMAIARDHNNYRYDED